MVYVYVWRGGGEGGVIKQNKNREKKGKPKRRAVVRKKGQVKRKTK